MSTGRYVVITPEYGSKAPMLVRVVAEGEGWIMARMAATESAEDANYMPQVCSTKQIIRVATPEDLAAIPHAESLRHLPPEFNAWEVCARLDDATAKRLIDVLREIAKEQKR